MFLLCLRYSTTRQYVDECTALIQKYPSLRPDRVGIIVPTQTIMCWLVYVFLTLLFHHTSSSITRPSLIMQLTRSAPLTSVPMIRHDNPYVPFTVCSRSHCIYSNLASLLHPLHFKVSMSLRPF